MNPLRAFSRVVDALMTRIGHAAIGLVLVIVAVSSLSALARDLINQTSTPGRSCSGTSSPRSC